MAVEDPELDDLYQEVILDHYRSPHNRGRLPQPTVSAEGYNPVCGDEITLDLLVEGDLIADVRFHGQGCSISLASASMMSEAIKGLRLEEVAALAAAFRGMMYGGAAVDPASLGELEALQGVAKFPVRVKCATLAWNTLQEALTDLKARRK